MRKGLINVSIANVYRDPSYNSEITSQVLLGEHVHITEREKDFTYITMVDGYKGWISNYQWVPSPVKQANTVKVRAHFIRCFEKPDAASKAIRDAVIGSELILRDQKGSWFQIELPDGLTGWAQKDSFGPFPDNSRRGIVNLASEFLGYPYMWGGRSPRGFDCSGLTQLVFMLIGIKIPRDSWMQQEAAKYKGDNLRDAESGDLYFFSENAKKITHVGIAMPQRKILHARGFVKMNSLDSGENDYDPQLQETFVDVRSFFH